METDTADAPDDSKVLELALRVQVPASLTEGQLAEKLGAALAPLRGEVLDHSLLLVHTLPTTDAPVQESLMRPWQRPVPVPWVPRPHPWIKGDQNPADGAPNTDPTPDPVGDSPAVTPSQVPTC